MTTSAARRSFDSAGVIVSVIVGAGGCDLVLPEGKKEAVAFRGEPEALGEWIAAGPWEISYRRGVVKVKHTEGGESVAS